VSTEVYHISINALTVQVVRKDIKNLHVAVYPPEGRVRVAAPWTMSDEAVRLAVISRLSWIKRQQADFQAQARQSDREMVSGESHFFLGQRYRLRVVEDRGPAKVLLRNSSFLEMKVRPGTSIAKRGQLLQRWYREQLSLLIPELISKWEPMLGVHVAEWRLRRMKTKWGSCNAQARRIWLNTELAKKAPECLEYVVLHEMTHLLERRHNDRFIALMDKHLPQWRLYRDTLNAAPLVHDTWESREIHEQK
jgi:predicted metal-dependent hydrolase